MATNATARIGCSTSRAPRSLGIPMDAIVSITRTRVVIPRLHLRLRKNLATPAVPGRRRPRTVSTRQRNKPPGPSRWEPSGSQSIPVSISVGVGGARRIWAANPSTHRVDALVERCATSPRPPGPHEDELRAGRDPLEGSQQRDRPTGAGLTGGAPKASSIAARAAA